MTKLIDSSKLYECPKELAAQQYKTEIERQEAIVRLSKALMSISVPCMAMYNSQNGKGSVIKRATAVIRFAMKHYGIVIPQSMFPREHVERHDYLYQLELLVPETFFNKAIANHIFEGVRMRSIMGAAKPKLMRSEGVTDFMNIEIKKAYSVYHDKPKEGELVGSW